MSSTTFAAAHAAILAALRSAPVLAGGNIRPNRLRPIPAAQNSALVLRIKPADGSEGVIGQYAWACGYSVECYYRGASFEEDLVAGVDPLLSATWERLAAINLSAIGVDLSVNPSIDWQFDDGETPVVCAVIGLTARHTTATTTLTAWS